MIKKMIKKIFYRKPKVFCINCQYIDDIYIDEVYNDEYRRCYCLALASKVYDYTAVRDSYTIIRPYCKNVNRFNNCPWYREKE